MVDVIATASYKLVYDVTTELFCVYPSTVRYPNILNNWKVDLESPSYCYCCGTANYFFSSGIGLMQEPKFIDVIDSVSFSSCRKVCVDGCDCYGILSYSY